MMYVKLEELVVIDVRSQISVRNALRYSGNVSSLFFGDLKPSFDSVGILVPNPAIWYRNPQ